MPCEMCGREVVDSDLYYARIEGSIIKVCELCKGYGEVIKKVKIKQVYQDEKRVISLPKLQPEEEEMVVENYAELIKNAREKKGVKQEDFAKQINEKESLIHKIETSHMEPSIELAKKIQHFLGIRLVEEVKIQDYKSLNPKGKADELTIGDVIKIKKR
jgi:putative transcription factor